MLVMLALEYGVKKVVGVEYSVTLHNTAAKNVQFFKLVARETRLLWNYFVQMLRNLSLTPETRFCIFLTLLMKRLWG